MTFEEYMAARQHLAEERVGRQIREARDAEDAKVRRLHQRIG